MFSISSAATALSGLAPNFLVFALFRACAAIASRLGPALTLGSGALVAATGAVIYILARVKFDDAASSCPCREGEFAAWERATNVSYGLLDLPELLHGCVTDLLERRAIRDVRRHPQRSAPERRHDLGVQALGKPGHPRLAGVLGRLLDESLVGAAGLEQRVPRLDLPY